MLKTIGAVRKSFWDIHPEYAQFYRKNKRQNEYQTDIRTAFVDYVDYLHRNGEISDKLANRLTL